MMHVMTSATRLTYDSAVGRSIWKVRPELRVAHVTRVVEDVVTRALAGRCNQVTDNWFKAAKDRTADSGSWRA